uniref:Uncharacterized protein n=1 Tax=Globisporangium ultimum (strain ATCC 200006 / CBS 805.95 / DAOM BR144) TaxID=431595 RepID=K3XC60_GLOUD
MLFTDILCSRIMWKKPTSQSSSTAEYQRMSSQAGRRQPSSAFFQKCLLVADITAVVEDKQTRVFKRSVAKASDDNQCISIVTPKRTLDIRALTLEDFNILLRGLSQLVQESSCTQDYPS